MGVVGSEAACPTGCARRGYPAAGPGPRRPWAPAAAGETPQDGYYNGRACAKAHEPCRSFVGRQAAVFIGGFLVGMGAMAVW